jgi:GNAT superfamily N-acetyltransferase
VPTDVDALAAAISALPLMQRYGRDQAALAADFRAAYERGESLFVWDPGQGAEGVLWFFPTGTFAMGGYLRLIAMAPGSSSQGAGAKLLAEFEAQVSASSRHAFLLVSDFNVDAHRFYEKHGYTKVGALPKLVRPDVDELVYWKRLR